VNNSSLGENGKMRLKTCLASGRVLSRHVLARTDIDAGTVLAAGFDVSENLSPSVLEEARADSGDSRILSAAAIFDVLRRIDGDFESTFVVVENDIAKPDDPAILQRNIGSVIVFDGVVYHLKRLVELTTPESLSEYLGSSSSGYPLNALVVKSLTRQQIASAFAKRRLGKIVENVETIINSIFDNDGFAIWVPNRLLACSSP